MLPLIDAMQVSIAAVCGAGVLMFLVLAFAFGMLSMVAKDPTSDAD